jgi:serine/threonine protein kinase
MYRMIEEKVHGVLADFDLASRMALMDDDYTKTSQQRTGTPPFMAHGLLDGTDPSTCIDMM